MSLVPVRYEDDFWPSRYGHRFREFHDPYIYNLYDDVLPLEFERMPLTSSRMWSAFEDEMRRIHNQKRRAFDDSFLTRGDNWRLKDLFDIPRRITDDFRILYVDDMRLIENFRMDNPIIEKADGTQRFYLEYDMSQFKPEEINVKTSGRKLSINAKHEEKDENHSSRREYSRKYLLPNEVDPEMLTSKLSESGKLTVEAPVPLPALKTGNKDKMLPIDHEY